jgi:hypothetical protein
MEDVNAPEQTVDPTSRSPRRRRSLATTMKPGGRDESGAVLILALVFLVIVGALVGSLTTWASNDLNNTAKFTSSRTLQYAASSAMETAIGNMRYSPLFASQLPSVLTPPTTTSTSPSFCWGTSASAPSALLIDNVNIGVWCSTAYTPTSAATRVVTFSACPVTPTVTGTSCAANPTLQAVVTFDDYPAGSNPPIPDECVAYCGTSMTVNSWNWSGGIAPTTTTTTTVPPTTTTTTVPPTTTTTTTAPQSNGVTATASDVISGTTSVNNGGTDTITLNNPSAITALTITINVAQTSTVAYKLEWNNFWTQWGTNSYTTSGGYIVYTFVLTAGQSMNAGFNGYFSAQYSDGGQAHNPTGDTWSVASTSGGVSSTLTGAF